MSESANLILNILIPAENGSINTQAILAIGITGLPPQLQAIDLNEQLLPNWLQDAIAHYQTQIPALETTKQEQLAAAPPPPSIPAIATKAEKKRKTVPEYQQRQANLTAISQTQELSHKIEQINLF